MKFRQKLNVQMQLIHIHIDSSLNRCTVYSSELINLQIIPNRPSFIAKPVRQCIDNNLHIHAGIKIKTVGVSCSHKTRHPQHEFAKDKRMKKEETKTKTTPPSSSASSSNNKKEKPTENKPSNQQQQHLCNEQIKYTTNQHNKNIEHCG